MEHWSEIFPIVFFPVKFLILGIGMYYAIKWHHDEDNRRRKAFEELEDMRLHEISGKVHFLTRPATRKGDRKMR